MDLARSKNDLIGRPKMPDSSSKGKDRKGGVQGIEGITHIRSLKESKDSGFTNYTTVK